jgi:hypothetical protein
MTTKDYVYLGLISLSVIVFYLHGYAAGANRTRRLFERWLQPSDTITELPPEEEDDAWSAANEDPLTYRRKRTLISTTTIRATFGKN